jgi:hypothetical protein
MTEIQCSLSHPAAPRLNNQQPHQQRDPCRDLAGNSPGLTRGRSTAGLLLQQALAQKDGGMRMAMLLQVDFAAVLEWGGVLVGLEM